MKHRIIRTFPSRDPLSVGQVVDTTDWRPRNRAQLEKGRYIERVPDETPLTGEDPPAAPRQGAAGKPRASIPQGAKRSANRPQGSAGE